MLNSLSRENCKILIADKAAKMVSQKMWHLYRFHNNIPEFQDSTGVAFKGFIGLMPVSRLPQIMVIAFIACLDGIDNFSIDAGLD